MALLKYAAITFFIALSTNLLGQDLKSVENNLIAALAKIHYWHSYNWAEDDTTTSPLDSLQKYNDVFKKMLVKECSSNSGTISYNFKTLADSGLKIITSEDGLFRIYSWDTWTGGTMHYYKNMFQYKANGKVNVQTIELTNEDPGCYYKQVNAVIAGDKKFYITQNISILSSALSYHTVKIFSIDDDKLNDTAKLIKTKTGIRNELGYEVDLASSANRDKDEVPEFAIIYDNVNKVISIPVILESGEVTARRIKYKFNGEYFEKL